jgi:hypothetical protein
VILALGTFWSYPFRRKRPASSATSFKSS